MRHPGQHPGHPHAEPTWEVVEPPAGIHPAEPGDLFVGAEVALTYNMFARYCIRSINGDRVMAIQTCLCGGEVQLDARDLLIIDDPDRERICGPATLL